MEKIRVMDGVYWVEIPEEDLFVLCGCPADVVKHLMIRGLILPRNKNGVAYESGPNAILLSDVSIQKGQFANLAEFPVLQMLYRQGMLIPHHPNNKGKKPIMIGTANQIRAQSEYISRGNYGLKSKEEIIATGIDEDVAEEIFKLKMKFAFNQIRPTDELIDFYPIISSHVELPGGVLIRRTALNVFSFQYKGKSLTVDLNLGPGEEYKPAINLSYHSIKREYFSIIHIGEGDGWDVMRPCMSSLITFQGKIYLIDTGPNILNSLTSLGIGVNEIEGIFHTHAHDDHFAGLTSLIHSDHRIKYYAVPLVRATVVKKLSSLMSISERRVHSSFVINDLEFNKWNNIDGLEVMPILSPHPVETSVMVFRSFWEGGHKTYTHLADIPSLKVLEDLLGSETKKSDTARQIYDTFKSCIMSRANLKKIDVGGGLIHGVAEDFLNDRSDKILLSHTASNLTVSEKEIGSQASFGQEDVLIEAYKDHFMQSAFHFLKEYFPRAPVHDLNMLHNCPIESFNAGAIMIKKGDRINYVFLILNGVAEYIDAERGISSKLSTASFLGEFSAINNEPSPLTYRSVSYVKALKIPVDIYHEFIKRNFDLEDMQRLYDIVKFLQTTYLFGEMISSLIQHKIARQAVIKRACSNEELIIGLEPKLVLIFSGKAALYAGGQLLETLSPGDFFGEETILLNAADFFTAVAHQDVELMIIPKAAIKDIPIIEWKIRETFEKRLTVYDTLFDSD